MQEQTARANKQLAADLSLVGVVLIWGATFILIKDALRETAPLLFLSVRFGSAAAALLLIVLFTGRWAGWRRRELAGGLLIGLAYWLGFILQTVGLQYTTASNAGFITGLSVVLVPLFAYLLLGQRPGVWPVVGVVVAVVGLALLSVQDGFTVGIGDWLQIASAACFAMQIVLVSRYAAEADALRLSLVAMAVAGALSLLGSVAFELPVGVGWLLPPNVLLAAVFMGLVASALAQVLQAVAQRATSPTHVALIFTLEPVAAAAFAWLLGGELLSGRQLFGCGLILGGMLLAEFAPQLVGKQRKMNKQSAVTPLPSLPLGDEPKRA